MQNATGKFPWATIGGYDFNEVQSCLQKSIRRGLEQESLFWATELYLSNYSAHAWVRLQVIASEDVGIADPNVCVQVHTLKQQWEGRKKEPDARLYFIHAVLVLVRSAKSRLVDNAGIVMCEGERPHIEVPDWALDVHTERGRALGRFHAHFFEEGARLVNEVGEDEYSGRAKQIRTKEDRAWHS
jgi:replication-associated recombination protein RarA